MESNPFIRSIGADYFLHIQFNIQNRENKHEVTCQGLSNGKRRDPHVLVGLYIYILKLTM